MKTNIEPKKVSSARVLRNVIEHVADMERQLEMVEQSNWNRDAKNRCYRDLASEALTMKIIIRGAETDTLYDRLTLIAIQANARQIYLND